MVHKEKRDLQVFPGNSHRMLFMPLRSAASHIFCYAKSGCCATPRLAGKTTHPAPIIAAGTLAPFIRILGKECKFSKNIHAQTSELCERRVLARRSRHAVLAR